MTTNTMIIVVGALSLSLATLLATSAAAQSAEDGDRASSDRTTEAEPSSSPGAGGASVHDKLNTLLDEESEEVIDLEDGPGGEATPWSRGVPRDQRERARRLLLEGNERAEDDHHLLAAEKYLEALELWPHPAFHYNLAVVQREAGRLAEAYINYTRAIRHGPGPLGKKGEEKYQEAGKNLVLLDKQLARLVVVCNEPGAEVTLDGVPVFTAPGSKTLRLAVGPYSLAATRAGLEPVTQSLILTSQGEETVVLRFTYPVTVEPVPLWLRLSVTGLGVALAATGGYFHWKADETFAGYDDDNARECTGSEGCGPVAGEPIRNSELRDAEGQRDLAMGAYIVGGITLTTAVALSYFGREHEVLRSTPNMPPATPGGPVSISPTVSRDGVGVSAILSF